MLARSEGAVGDLDTLVRALDEQPSSPSQSPDTAASGIPADITASLADVDLVIPAYNEEQRISSTVEGICGQMYRSAVRARIIVVDNGSVDATAEAADRAFRHGMSLSVISCGTQGKGAAVKAGVRAATAPLVGYVDADQSTPPEALVTGIAILQSGWDVVVGSRRAFGASYVVPQDLVRRLGSRAFNLAASTLVGRVSDTQCGMKLFRTQAAQRVFKSVVLGGFAFDVEVLARCKAAGLRIMEMPVSWSDSSGSTFRPVRDGVQAFGELGRLRRVLGQSC